MRLALKLFLFFAVVSALGLIGWVIFNLSSILGNLLCRIPLSLIVWIVGYFVLKGKGILDE
jgi:hypothetical protein